MKTTGADEQENRGDGAHRRAGAMRGVGVGAAGSVQGRQRARGGDGDGAREIWVAWRCQNDLLPGGGSARDEGSAFYT